jgi:hypothetical protein
MVSDSESSGNGLTITTSLTTSDKTEEEDYYPCSYPLKAKVDALYLRLPFKVNREDLIKWANLHAFEISDHRDKEVRGFVTRLNPPYFLRCPCSKPSIRIRTDANGQVFEVMLNPSHLGDFYNTVACLRMLLPFQMVLGLSIRRFDIAIDYPLNFPEILRGTDIKFKRKIRHFSDDVCGVRTQVVAGVSFNKVSIYDKGKLLDLKQGDLTRIEIQNIKLPKDLKILSNFPKIINCFNPFQRHLVDPFENIHLGTKSLYSEADVCRSQKDYLRYGELSAIMRRDGYNAARKALNTNGNFARDYGKFVHSEEFPFEQPSLIFQRDLKIFFKGYKECLSPSRLRIGEFILDEPTYDSSDLRISRVPKSLSEDRNCQSMLEN